MSFFCKLINYISKTSIIAVLLYCNYACNGYNTASEADLSNALKISIKFEYDNEDIISFIDRIEFIPLQTSDESLIGEITEIAYRNNKYYIFDEQQQKILIFDSTGKYISSIDKKGNGRCEYTKIYDMRVDDSGTIEILSRTYPGRITKYSNNNTECEIINVKSKMSGDRFVPLNNGYLFYQAMGSNNVDNQCFLFSTDENGNVQNKWLPSHSYVPYEMSRKVLKVFDDTVLFCMPLDYNIYQISSDGNISVRYALDFGECNMPKFVKNLYINGNLQEFQKQSEGYVREIDIWYETQQVLMFSYMNTSMATPFFALYIKNRRELKIFNPDDLVKIAVLYPVATFDDTFFLSSIDVSTFPFDKYPEYKETVRESYPGLMSIADTLTEYANPVLIKYKFKD
jgi:hypothetical protein